MGGQNGKPQLSLNHSIQVKIPQLCEGLPPIRLICGGHHLSTFVDGKVWKSGETQSAPELQEGLEGILYADCSAHSIFLDSTGNVWVAGSNSEGQLGLAINPSQPEVFSCRSKHVFQNWPGYKKDSKKQNPQEKNK